ncbi:MAG: hypothetical protein A2Y65_05700 [Deltaproteobacteria bacterium RBG_13_52_11]|nr:MAG: hypothetical protein A2Y65_05700 [Deltaproteobacteria bacterium RBG_13_52_11]
MKAKRTFYFGAGLVFLVTMAFAISTLAAEGVFISDVKQNPSKYYNLQVKIKGVVVDVTPEQGGLKSGLYTLRDESEQTIEIKTDELPAPGQSFIVEGIVTMKAGTQTPFLKELKRGGGNLLPIIVIGAAVIVLILIGILVYMLRRPVAMEPAYEEAGAIEPTRPITTEEMKRVAPAPERTVEVPAVPAQLEVLNGPNKGEKYILKRQNMIGREAGDVALGDPTVSAEHAQITFKNRKYVLTNKSLTNPAKVNKATVETRELKDGDEIVLGAIKLKFSKL